MKIFTLCLSPAYDVHCEAELALLRENFARVTSREAGGKGVNLARALAVLGIPSRLGLLTGAEDELEFFRGLRADGLDFVSVSLAGPIRRNFTFHGEGGETRISFPGPSAEAFSGILGAADTLRRLEEKLGTVEPGDIVTLGGSLPEGLSLADAKDFVRRLTARGLRVVIDSRSFSAMDLLELRPWLIKPNAQEFRAMAGPCVLEEDGTLSIGKAAAVMNGLHGCGIENVMLSLGSRGALLCCSEGVYYAKAQELEAVSTVGAGDSLIAGYLAGTLGEMPARDRLALAVAAGAAACLTEGSRPPERAQIEAFYPTVTVQKLIQQEAIQ